jgi:hypothetical protein
MSRVLETFRNDKIQFLPSRSCNWVFQLKKNLYISQVPWEAGTTVNPVLERRKLRFQGTSVLAEILLS